MTDVNPTSVICVNHAFSHGFLISYLGWISIVSEGFSAESVYVYTYEMFTELRKRRYLGETSQSKHGREHRGFPARGSRVTSA